MQATVVRHGESAYGTSKMAIARQASPAQAIAHEACSIGTLRAVHAGWSTSLMQSMALPAFEPFRCTLEGWPQVKAAFQLCVQMRGGWCMASPCAHALPSCTPCLQPQCAALPAVAQLDSARAGSQPIGCPAELALRTPPHTHYLLVDPPELAAGVCLWLATPQADFLRGRFVRANWDLTELEQRSAEIVAQDLFKLRLAC